MIPPERNVPPLLRARPLLPFLFYMAMACLIASGPPLQLFSITIHVGVLLFLLAGQAWGLIPGLVVAACAALASWQHGHAGLQVLHWVGLYLTSFALSRRGLLLAEGTLLFHFGASLLLLIVAQAGVHAQVAPFILLHYLESAAPNVLIAAFGDIMLRSFRWQQRAPWLVMQHRRSLTAIVRTSINMNLALLFLLTVTWQSQQLEEQARSYRLRVDSRLSAQQSSILHTPPGVFRSLTLNNGSRLEVARMAPGTDPLAQARSLRPGTCHRITRRRQYEPLGEVGSQAWLTRCEVVALSGSRNATVVVIHAETVRRLAEQLAATMSLLFIFTMLVVFYLISVNIHIREGIIRVRRAISTFGTRDIPVASDLYIADFGNIIRAVADRNRLYMDALDKRAQLVEAVSDLHRNFDFRTILDVRIDLQSGLLSFTQVELDGTAHENAIHVHGSDLGLFVQIRSSEDALIEFRARDGEESTFLLTLHGAEGLTGWRSGVIVRVRQPKRMREFLLHNARLADLGGMASAICHEMKQPLFTIDIAARSIGLLAIGKAQEVRTLIEERSQRINAEVNRAREIIDRIANYGRVNLAEGGDADPRAAFETAGSLLEARIRENNIAIDLNGTPGRKVAVPRIALEQVMVNLLQNAIDAILEARRRGNRPGVGNIRFDLEADDSQVCFTVSDDGIGFEDNSPTTLFEPFFTTKSDKGGSGLGLYIAKQIIIEAQGRIDLRQRTPHGCVVEVRVPQGVEQSRPHP